MEKKNNIIHMRRYKTLKERKAANLRRFMEQFGLKQKDIADILGAPEPNISDMLRCKRSITDRTIEILSASKHIDSAFFFHTPDESPLGLDTVEKNIILRVRKDQDLKHKTDEITRILAGEESGVEEGREGGAVREAGGRAPTHKKRKTA